jgi:hypothetical protein
VGGACSTYGRKEKGIKDFVETRKGKRQFGGIDVRIILE